MRECTILYIKVDRKGNPTQCLLPLCKAKEQWAFFWWKLDNLPFYVCSQSEICCWSWMSGTKVPKVCTVCLYTHRVSNIRKQSLCWQNVGYEVKSWNGWNLHFALTCVVHAIGPSVFKPLTHLSSPSKMNFYNLVESSTTTRNKNKQSLKIQ
jgi:hypothetical protein